MKQKSSNCNKEEYDKVDVARCKCSIVLLIMNSEDLDFLNAVRSFADAFPDKSKTAVPDARCQ